MNRVAKIVIYALVLFLLYLWISSVAKSCNNREVVDEMELPSESEDYSADGEIYDEYFESDEEEAMKAEEEVSDTRTYEEKRASDEEEYDEDFSFEKEEKTKISPSKTIPTKSTEPRAAANNSSGKYIIVAGSYLIKDNADKMVSKLKNLGFPNAEVIVFENSQYHTISAGMFNSYDDASASAQKIKNKGIDCYVHTRK